MKKVNEFKKKAAALIAAVLMIVLSVTPVLAETSLEIANRDGANLPEIEQPQGSIITELNTGRILWEENIDKQWTPASMSKLMIILLAYDKIAKGELSLDTEVTVTEDYLELVENPDLSNNNAVPGCKYTISEIIDLIIVPSSAAGTYLLADTIEPDRNKQVEMMNERAKSLGMTETEYVNPIGVPTVNLGSFAPPGADLSKDNLTSSRDYAILATELLTKYPDIINHTDKAVITVKKGTPYEETFEGYNHSLPGDVHPFKGMDGIKTGSAGKGYNMTGTAKRGDTRLVEVILGIAEWDYKIAEWDRHIISNAIMEKTFNEYEYRKVLSKGENEIDGKKVVLEEDLWDCVPKDFNSKNCKISDDGKYVSTGVKTEFLPGHKMPKVKVIEKKKFADHLLDIFGIIVILAVFFIIISAFFKTRKNHKER